MIIGATGMLGSSIYLTNTNHELIGTYLGEKPNSSKIIKLDITKEENVKKVINNYQPEAIINTAAITNVDLCEKNRKLAENVHILGTKYLVAAAEECNSYFLYISTDSVFDGIKGNYNEKDKPRPLNVYAQTKFEGEKETLKYQNSSVIRTNIYGYNWLNKESIAEWIINTLKKEKKINLFRDVYFTPILVNNLSQALLEIVERKLKGIFHIAGAENVTKINFGKKIAELWNLDEELIEPISIYDLNLKADRPLKPTLDITKCQKILRTKLLNLEEGLKLFRKLADLGYLERLRNL